jgi:signal transduction histidine kinase
VFKQAASSGVNLAVHTSLDEDEVAAVLVEGDDNKLQLVLLNILSNALKFTPRGGLVQVIVGIEQNVTVDLRGTIVTEHSRFLRVDVSDTGIGISQVSALYSLRFDLPLVSFPKSARFSPSSTLLLLLYRLG